MCEGQSVEFYVPPKEFCGDNGAMIAWLGLLMHKNGKWMSLDETKVIPNYRTDMVEVNWIKDIKGRERKIPEHLIGKGAEADIKRDNYLDFDVIIKERVKKSYRDERLDEKIRKSRTAREARYLASGIHSRADFSPIFLNSLLNISSETAGLSALSPFIMALSVIGASICSNIA
jgi:N6-L-threonylcarbamoyladenine synthase/protein kinase Bud32